MKQYILSAEAARVLGVTPNTVRELARRGALPADWVGTVRLFNRVVVDRIARARRLKAAGTQSRAEREQ